MALPTQSIEVSLAQGLDQKTGELKRAPGHLDRAVNIETDKVGRVNKRRGYRLVALDDAISTILANDILMMHVATYHDELVVFSHDTVISVASQGSNLNNTTAAVVRGPCNRGNGRLVHVSTSKATRDPSDPVS